jgi:alpha-mannosidase
VEIFYQDELNSILEANSYSSFKGEVYDYIEFTYNFGDSSLKQTIKLEKNSKRLDFDNHAQWFETRKMLRTSFETTINSTEATFDIQYGNVKRSTTNNTSWELAQFEVCAHKYADLSNSRCGVALLNDCKYGYKVKNSTLDLALLRSPKHPDFSADRGEHFFTYSIYLHKGEAMDSNLLSEAAALNRKPLVFEGVKNVNTKPICKLSGDGLSLAVVKKAEKSSCLVIRVVETKGRYSSGSIQFNNPVEVIPTNLIEWEDKNSITLATGKLDLELSPFEIRTYKVIFK